MSSSPQGPLSNFDVVCLTCWNGGEFYSMTYDDEDFQYEKIQSANAIPKNVARFILQINSSGQYLFTMTEPVASGRGIGIVETENGLLISARSAEAIELVDVTYEPWKDSIALAGIPYKMMLGEDILLAKFVKRTELENGQIESEIVIEPSIPTLVPVHFFENCSSTACTEGNDYKGAVARSFCSSYLEGEGCSTIPLSSWTTLEEASEGHFYNYCPVDVHCGPSCKSPCDDIGDKCKWNFEEGTYSCQAGAVKSTATLILIIIIIGAIIAVIAAIIFGIWLIKRGKSNKKSKK